MIQRLVVNNPVLKATLNNISRYQVDDDIDFERSEYSTEKYFDIDELIQQFKVYNENFTYIFREGYCTFSIDQTQKLIRITSIFIHQQYRCFGIFEIIEQTCKQYFDKIEIISIQTKRFAEHLFNKGYRPLFDGSTSFVKVFINDNHINNSMMH